nr:hypothetical protein HmN_000875100 [Hymenolepis microstoma]
MLEVVSFRRTDAGLLISNSLADDCAGSPKYRYSKAKMKGVACPQIELRISSTVSSRYDMRNCFSRCQRVAYPDGWDLYKRGSSITTKVFKSSERELSGTSGGKNFWPNLIREYLVEAVKQDVGDDWCLDRVGLEESRGETTLNMKDSTK